MTTSIDTVSLWRQAAGHLHMLGTLDETRRRIERELQEVRDQLVAAGEPIDQDREIVTEHGTVRLAPGPVTRRRSVDTLYLDTHFEDLPKQVRELCEVKETVTVNISDVDFTDVDTLLGIASRSGAEVRRRNVWPTVRELERNLPADVAVNAVIQQERSAPILVLDAGVVEVRG